MRTAASVLILCAQVAAGAVIGIDLGGRFLKVGIIQPGTGIDLVLNEATKRKSSSTAGFNAQGERLYGDESQNLLGKLPETQFVLSKMLLGKPVDSDAVRTFTQLRYPYTFFNDEDTGAAVLKYGNSTYRSEELVAFVLSYAKQISERHAGSVIKDCVITIPPFFDHMEREAMLNAASIAGLNVLSLMHENTAFAFKYGFDKEVEFSSEPTNVVFYDLGATSYKVSVVAFTSVVGKKNKTTGSMTVKGVAWDESLGGVHFDQVVLEMLADNFNEKRYKNKEDDVRNYPRAVGKLRKEAERVKEVLSANQQFQVGIEAVHDDIDLKLKINRADFEERASHLWPKLLPPLESILAQANLTKDQIHRVEVIGGATRIPRVKEVAKEFFAKNQLDGALNGDEAAAFGATLYAAKLSTSFRLRDFTIVDAFPHAINIRLGTDDASATTEDGAEEGTPSKGKDKLLFKANTKFPHKKLITMSRTEDLMVALSYRPQDEDSILPGSESTLPAGPIETYNISGVAAATTRLTSSPSRTAIGKPKVAVTFALNSHGLLDISKSEISLEMLESYEDFEMVPANESNSNMSNATDIAEPTENATNLDENVTSGSNGSNASNATSMVKVKVMKERKRVHYSTLKATREVHGAVSPINSTTVAACIERNVKLLQAEELRRVNAEAKNVLESFIIDTRDKISSDENLEKVSTEEARAEISAEFEKMEDWLYEEGMDTVAATYQSKKRDLEKLTQPIFLRLYEMEQRPKVIAQALEAINWTVTILGTWATERPEVTDAERAHVQELCDNFTTWLAEKEEEQAKLELHQPPAFVSYQVTQKLEPIEKEVRKLIKKPKPKPKPPKKANATNGTNTTGSAKANETSAEEASMEEPATTTDPSEAEAEAASEANTTAADEDEEELKPHDEL